MDDSTRFPSVPPISGEAVPPVPPADRGPPSLSGEAETARVLFTFWPFLLVVLRRWGVPERDAADVAQEILLEVLSRLVRMRASGRGRPVAVWRAYLRVAARRAAGAYCRREAARAERLGHDLCGEACGEPSPEDVLLAREVAALLGPAIATTPERWRALHAFAVAGVPVPVIARAEQVPPGTIRTRILLARRDLRAALRRHRLM